MLVRFRGELIDVLQFGKSSRCEKSDCNVVSIVKGENIVKRICHAVELIGGIEKIVHKGDKVLIKPNLVDGKPYESGETVHPDTIRTLIRLAKAAGASKVIVGDVITSEDLTLHRICEKMAKEEDAEMIDFNENQYVKVEVEDPVYFKRIRVAKALLQCDVLINVPTLKTHHLAGVTGALKNLYGTLAKKERIYFHRIDKIEEIIVDLNIVKPSDLVVIDGTYSTHHLPPFEVQRMDLTLAGNNSVSVDAVAAKVMGVEPRTLRYLRWAEEHGLGNSDLTKIQILGLSIEDAFKKKTVTSVDYVNRKYDKIKVINGSACTGCFGRICTALFRGYNAETLKETLYILMGPEAKLPDSSNVILCGNCLAPTFYNKLKGEFLAGCPPDLEAFRKVLEKFSLYKSS